MDRHMLLDTYQKLEERLAKLDFASLLAAFAKPSPLYTDESMCFDGSCCLSLIISTATRRLNMKAR